MFTLGTAGEVALPPVMSELRIRSPPSIITFNWNFHLLEVVFFWSYLYAIRFDKMEANDFQILLIDVTF